MKRTLIGVSAAIALSAAAVVLGVAWLPARAPAPSPLTLPAARGEPVDAFPWVGETVLEDDAGQRLSWTVDRVEGEVHIKGLHPNWRVEHRARVDGTPLFTVKQSRGMTTRVTWLAEGARVERTDASGKKSNVTIHEVGLWDGSTLDARLAGVSWGPGKQLRLRIADLDLADGTVYPMIAEYVRQERCANDPCHRVLLALDDFRRLVSPTFESFYSTAPGAKFLRYDGEGFSFRAAGR